MDAIYSATALRDHPREVKQAARERLVRITENGNGAYVFCSEEVFQREVDDAVERALYAQRVSDAIDRGRADIAAGRYVEGTEAAKAAVADKAGLPWRGLGSPRSSSSLSPGLINGSRSPYGRSSRSYRAFREWVRPWWNPRLDMHMALPASKW